MTTCSPNCPATAIGTDAASICTECATATIAGASFDLTTLAASLAAATVVTIACRFIGKAALGWSRTKRTVLA